MYIVDLTLDISEKLQVFPGSPSTKILEWSNFNTGGYSSEVLFASTHIGTHIDAPFHFNPNGPTVDKIELEKLFINNNIKVLKIEKKDDELIEVDDFTPYNIRKNDTILINTNWVNNRKEEKYFIKNPGLSEKAANYLSESKINLIGIDTPNIDPGLDKNFKSHNILLGNNIPIIENLINVDKLLDKTFTFVALPLKIANSSGSPIRAIAVIN